MATDIELNTKINTANSAQALGELKKSLKDLISLQGAVANGSENFKKLGIAINAAESKITDLNNATNNFRGTGVERLTSSFGMLKEGFSSFDTGKIKTAFNGLGAAMKAIPIFLVIEGVQYLIENFEKLTNSGGIVGDLFGAISDGIGYAVQKLKDFADWIGVADFKATAFAENQIKQAKEAKDAVGERYDYEIAKANAAGKAVEGLEREKAIASRKAIDAEMNSIVKLSNIKGKLSEDDEKRLKELGKERVKTLQAEELANIKFVKNIDEAIVKQTEKEKEEHKKRLEAYQKNIADKKAASIKEADELFAQLTKNEDARMAAEKSFQDREKKQEEERKNNLLLLRADQLKADQDEYNRLLEKAALEKKIIEETEKAKFDISKNAITSIQNLSDLAFSIKMANTKKGSVEEEKAARKQFVINKGIQISLAIISGIQGVLNALSAKSILPEPFATGLRITNAVAIGTAAAASVAKISAVQFNNSGFASEDKGSVSLGGAISGGAGGSIAPPPTVQPQQQNVTTFTGNNNNNTPQPIKTYVVETDLRNSTSTIDRIKQQSSF